MSTPNTYTLKVVAIEHETDDCVTVCFKQPALKKVKYLPGQYLTLIFNINGRRYIRPYSFSSAPDTDSTLNITVKRVPGGIISNHIIDKVKVDDLIEVMPPMGEFTLENVDLSSKPRLILWGAGSGITPLMSIMKYALHHNLCEHITLVYGNKNHNTSIFREQIEKLQNKYADSLSIWHFHTEAVVAEDDTYVIRGRIDPHKVMDVLKTEEGLKKTYHFVCGPSGLKASVKEAFSNTSISADKIFTEDFELVKDPAQFEDIVTRTITLVKDNSTFELEVIKGKSILESGLDASINMDYSCQTGTCLICKGKLLDGETKTIGISSLPDELAADERLLCCSFPLTDNVKIAI